MGDRRRVGALSALLVLALASGAAAQTSDGAGPRIAFARVGSSIPVGSNYGAIKGGLLCVVRERLEWTTREADSFSRASDFAAIFRTEARKAGFALEGGGGTDLFETRDEKADLRVGALLTEARIDVCMPFAGMDEPNYKQAGSVHVAVEWQVFSVVENRVIARIPTVGDTKSSGFKYDIAPKMLRDAFADAARRLVTSDEFYRVVRTRTAGASTPQAVATSPSLPLSLAVPAPATTPLKVAARGVVSIFAGDGLGSGVLISPDGYLLTNHHVAGDAGRVRIRWPDGTETVGEVIRADRRRDVALVKTTAPPAPPVPIRRGPAELGEVVYAVGTPLDKEFAGTVTRGVVSSTRMKDGLPFIQSDVSINHGNSGGALLDEKGQLIALAVFRLETGDGAGMGLSFFIPIDDALRVLAITPTPVAAAAPPPSAPAAGPRRPLPTRLPGTSKR